MSHKTFTQFILLVVILLASFASPGNVQAQSSCGSTYVVQPGDWLSKIADRCGVTLSQMYAANPGVGYYIYPGQVLAHPGWLQRFPRAMLTAALTSSRAAIHLRRSPAATGSA